MGDDTDNSRGLEGGESADVTERLADSCRTLASQRRINVLLRLREENVASIAELSEAVARRERGDGDPSAAHVDAVEVSLHHQHLPLLCDADVVEYDPDSGIVALKEMGAVEALIEAIFDTR